MGRAREVSVRRAGERPEGPERDPHHPLRGRLHRDWAQAKHKFFKESGKKEMELWVIGVALLLIKCVSNLCLC